MTNTATSCTGTEERTEFPNMPIVSADMGSQEADEGSTSCASARESQATVRKKEEVVVGQPKVTCLDVAEYILRRLGPMSTMKLQKLVYYSQAWSLVWDEAPLFDEPIEAWANGPVIRALFDYHRGMFDIAHIFTGNPDALNSSQRETIEAVLRFYGDKTAQWLIDLSHTEQPWLSARRGLPPTERGNHTINLDSMAEYYASL